MKDRIIQTAGITILTTITAAGITAATATTITTDIRGAIFILATRGGANGIPITDGRGMMGIGEIGVATEIAQDGTWKDCANTDTTIVTAITAEGIMMAGTIGIVDKMGASGNIAAVGIYFPPPFFSCFSFHSV